MRKKFQAVRAFPRAAIGFQPEYLDFQRGIRVGNLDDNQRITRILKLALEERYQQPFVTERYGRGVFWQWIGFLPRANREAKSMSSKASFGCSKFFLTVDTESRIFKCGFSVERGFLKPPADFSKAQLKPDWDWHRLLATLNPASVMARELKRLALREGFTVEAASGWDDLGSFDKTRFPSMARLKKVLQDAPADNWAGFQVYYPMPEKEVRSSSGVDLVESMLAIFGEVAPAMNLCMQIHLDA